MVSTVHKSGLSIGIYHCYALIIAFDAESLITQLPVILFKQLLVRRGYRSGYVTQPQVVTTLILGPCLAAT